MTAMHLPTTMLLLTQLWVYGRIVAQVVLVLTTTTTTQDCQFFLVREHPPFFRKRLFTGQWRLNRWPGRSPQSTMSLSNLQLYKFLILFLNKTKAQNRST